MWENKCISKIIIKEITTMTKAIFDEYNENEFPTISEQEALNPMLTDPVGDCKKGKLLHFAKPDNTSNKKDYIPEVTKDYDPMTDDNIKLTRSAINKSRNIYYKTFDTIKCIGSLIGGIGLVWESIIRDIDYFCHLTYEGAEASAKKEMFNGYNYSCRDKMLSVYDSMEKKFGSDDIYFHIISREYFKYIVRKSLVWVHKNIYFGAVPEKLLQDLISDLSEEKYDFVDPCPYYELLIDLTHFGDKYYPIRYKVQELEERNKKLQANIDELKDGHKLLIKNASLEEKVKELKDKVERVKSSKAYTEMKQYAEVKRLRTRVEKLEAELKQVKKRADTYKASAEKAERIARSELVYNEDDAINAIAMLLFRLDESDRTKLLNRLGEMKDNGSVPLLFLFQVLKKLGKDLALIDPL